jgi:hypothetical protein
MQELQLPVPSIFTLLTLFSVNVLFRLSQLILNVLDCVLGLGNTERLRFSKVLADVAIAIFRVNESGFY